MGSRRYQELQSGTVIPPSLLPIIIEKLEQAGDSAPLEQVMPVEGGCISHALRVSTGRESYFLKWDDRPLPGLFTAETRGLEMIRKVGAIRMPRVLAASDASGHVPGYILEEWIEPGQRPSDWPERLGAALARLHHRSASVPEENQLYGLDESNYLGLSPQPGGWESNWVHFFTENRLRLQVRLAWDKHLLSPGLSARLERLIDRLPEWLEGVHRKPVLIHGDLWSGNVLSDQGGEPVLVDPAVYYADREAELAYTELFGGFPAAFYDSYEHTWPTAPGRTERRDLYNLYHLLNHLNHFGERYNPLVESVVRKYVG